MREASHTPHDTFHRVFLDEEENICVEATFQWVHFDDDEEDICIKATLLIWQPTPTLWPPKLIQPDCVAVSPITIVASFYIWT